MSWHIEGWSSNKELFDGIRFNSYEEAREHISYVATQEADAQTPGGSVRGAEWEEIYDGICEDLYAVQDEDSRCEMCNLSIKSCFCLETL